MNKIIVLIVGLFVVGCNSGSRPAEETAIEEAIAEVAVTEPVVESVAEEVIEVIEEAIQDEPRSDINPIGDLYEPPYLVQAIEPEKESRAQFDGVVGAVDGINIQGQSDNGYIYQNITGEKPFDEYEFNVVINYRYAVYMDIYLDGFCAVGKYWRGEWLFSNPNIECIDYLSDPPQYNYDDFIALYGDMIVEEGRNFNAHLTRSYGFSGEWFIE